MRAASWSDFGAACIARTRSVVPVARAGRVRSVVGSVIEVEGLPARLGALCTLEDPSGGGPSEAEVVGFRGDRLLLMALGDAGAIGGGTRAVLRGSEATVAAGPEVLGRVLDGLGRPLDGRPAPSAERRVPLVRKPAPALSRRCIERPLDLGVRSINGLLTVGRGARIGLFAGSGVGKSTLLGQIARFTEADVIVTALIGERGREVREFVERDLGEALAHSVVVVATSDEAPLLRRRAALQATALAEDFRDQGAQVLLLMDSLTRFCTAQREIGLAAGEPPATRGYPPSVWSTLPRLVERAGTCEGRGAITAIYTVLVEGDDLTEPVADAARSLLDGHMVLSRQLAERGQHPAIDPLASVSRVMPDIVDAESLALAASAREALATYRDAEDLISVGAYVEGSDPAIDRARRLQAPLREFLGQDRADSASLAQSRVALERALSGEAR